MEKRTISIPKGAKIGPEQRPIYGWQEAQAYCKGGLCVHRRQDRDRFLWNVTHEASGMKIGALGGPTKTDAQARMEAALALGFDWTMDETETLAALKRDRSITDAIRKIGERD